MTTKYDIGQQVWCVSKDCMFTTKVDYISISAEQITYMFEYIDDEFTEDSVFDNSFDATLAWMELNDLAIEIPHIKTSVVAVIKQLESN